MKVWALNNNEFFVATRVLGWSVDDAASALEVDQRTVRRWLAGGQPVPPPLAGELADHLDRLDSDELIDAVRDAAELLAASRAWLERASVTAVNNGVSVADVATTAKKSRETIYRWVNG